MSLRCQLKHEGRDNLRCDERSLLRSVILQSYETSESSQKEFTTSIRDMNSRVELQRASACEGNEDDDER